MRDADQQTLGRQEAADRLPPRLVLIPDEHPVAARLELARRGFNALDIELAPRLRRRNIVRPRRATEAGLRRLRERPEREGLDAVERLRVEISALFLFESNAEAL